MRVPIKKLKKFCCILKSLTHIDPRGLPEPIEDHPEPLAPLPCSPLVNNVEFLQRLTTKSNPWYCPGLVQPFHCPTFEQQLLAVFVPRLPFGWSLEKCQRLSVSKSKRDEL
jgi:hypothetical protein